MDKSGFSPAPNLFNLIKLSSTFVDNEAAANKFVFEYDAPTINSTPMINNNNNNNNTMKCMEQQPWNVYAEDMYHVHCYQILIRPRIQQKLKLEHFELTFLPSLSSSASASHLQQQQKSIISWRYNHNMNGIPETSYSMEFRKEIRLTSPRVYLVDSDEAISIRLSYSSKDSEENAVESLVLLKPNQVQNICCRFCYNPLFGTPSSTMNHSNGIIESNDDKEKRRTIKSIS